MEDAMKDKLEAKEQIKHSRKMDWKNYELTTVIGAKERVDSPIGWHKQEP